MGIGQENLTKKKKCFFFYYYLFRSTSNFLANTENRIFPLKKKIESEHITFVVMRHILLFTSIFLLQFTLDLSNMKKYWV